MQDNNTISGWVGFLTELEITWREQLHIFKENNMSQQFA